MESYIDAYEVYELLSKWNHRGPPDVQKVERLFEERPIEAQRLFWNGLTLLHTAVDGYPQHSALINVIYKAYPQALFKEDENGNLPLHILLKSSSWRKYRDIQEVLEMFVVEFPDSIAIPRKKSGDTALHVACQRPLTSELNDNEEALIVEYLIKFFPDATYYQDFLRRTPLDIALKIEEPNPKIIKLLVNQCPVLLSLTDFHGNLPIHRIVNEWNNPTSIDEIIAILVDKFERSLSIQDQYGYTPLMKACTNDSPLSVVYSLVRKWPEQIMPNLAPTIFDPDKFNGELLYSSLCSASTTLSTVQQWLTAQQRQNDDPDNTIMRRDLNGRLPIHYAVVSKSDDAVDIVKLLLGDDHQTQIDQLSTTDDDGRLPIHFAAAFPQCSRAIFELLIQIYPEGLLKADKDGRLPWHYSDRSRQDYIFEMSNELYPEEMIDVDLDLVPEEIRWDILTVVDDEMFSPS
jgi:ankyrin repeat protein